MTWNGTVFRNRDGADEVQIGLLYWAIFQGDNCTYERGNLNTESDTHTHTHTHTQG
jgi:hypothetical protein